MSKRKLDPYTLRWAARRASRYERELRGFEKSAPNSLLRNLYERAAITAFVLKSNYLAQAKALESAGRKKAAK